ncbi:MAG: aminopeptidase P family protein, partial [Marinovum sp.]|nr:aminopeptidase P family protein [Marinovum sp.]
LRLIKSDAEISKISQACKIAGAAFSRVSEVASQGVHLEAVFRGFQKLCLDEGADWVPYLAGGAGPLGYDDVISPANDSPLCKGDILMLDTGLMYDGYFCDFDRNFSIGKPDKRISAGYAQLIEATEAGKIAAKAGNTAADVFHAMDNVLTGGKGGGDVGRLGHGLGMQLTEWPSFIPDDQTVLKEGMVITLEPAVAIPNGGMVVHEDNFVIRKSGIEQISPQAPNTILEI